jgi:glutamate-1-semialdehyde aminotransferase
MCEAVKGHQIVIAHGDAPYMWDIDGKRYLGLEIQGAES